MDTELAAAIGGAVVGALVGGLVSVGLLIIQQSANEALRDQEKKDRERALAHSLIFKLISISSTFERTTRHFESAFRGASEGTEPWQFVEGYASAIKHIDFSTEELALVMSLCEKCFNSLLSWDAIHNALSDALRVFSQKKDELNMRFPPVRLEGRVGTLQLTPEELLSAAPLIVTVNGLATDIRVWAANDCVTSNALLSDVVDMFNQRLGLKLSVKPKNTA